MTGKKRDIFNNWIQLLSVQSILRSLCICSSFALWLVQKTCTIYQPIKCKTKLNNTMVNLVFLFHSVYLLCTCSFHSPLMICPSVLISFQYSIKIKLIPLTHNNSLLNPLTPKCDLHLIFSYSMTPEPHIKVTWIKEMINN